MEALYSQVPQQMVNRSLEAETQAHLGHETDGKASGNPRNGTSHKTVQSTVVWTQRTRLDHRSVGASPRVRRVRYSA